MRPNALERDNVRELTSWFAAARDRPVDVPVMKFDSYYSGVLLIAVATSLAVLGLFVFRRLLASSDLISTHDVGGYLLSVVGTMYAVILGLIVVDALGRFQEALRGDGARIKRPGRHHLPCQ